ncbi:MAG: tRNA (adenosine(37)-N6)-threonylcarbamoyltransferase complex dimerization subunit type 1 TsaB [Planctomycetota bacterium]
MRSVAIETSGRKGSAALGLGPELVAEAGFPTDVEHARELIPAIDALCRRLGWPPETLDRCYLSIGPGSFTGLRVAVTFARHLELAVGVRICAVPTLDVIACNCADLDTPPANLAVVLDAKRRQVFAGVFEYGAGRYRRVDGPHLIEPARLIEGSPNPLAVCGEGIKYHREAIDRTHAQTLEESLWWPRAANVHQLGWELAEEGRFTSARDLTPLYVRRPEVEEVWEKRHGRSEPRP